MFSTSNSVNLKSASPFSDKAQEANEKDTGRRSLDSANSIRNYPRTPDTSGEPMIKHTESTGSITSHSHPFEKLSLAKVGELSVLDSHRVDGSDSEIEHDDPIQPSAQRPQSMQTPFAAPRAAIKAFSMPCVIGGYALADGSRQSPFLRTASDEIEPMRVDFNRPAQEIRGGPLVRTGSEELTHREVRQLTGQGNI